MRSLVGVFVTIIVLYSIYYDLSHGTLPAITTEQKTESQMKVASEIPYFEQTVGDGDTVLSIVENQLGRSLPIPISDVVTDFKKLNHDLPPQHIQSGKKYKFPDYSGEE